MTIRDSFALDQFWPLADDGSIQNLAEIRRMTSRGEEVAHEVLSELQLVPALQQQTCTILMRGSIAIGRERPPWSDVDVVVVMDHTSTLETVSHTLETVRHNLSRSLHDFESISIELLTYPDLLQQNTDWNRLRVNLSVSGRRLHGPAVYLPRFYPDRELFNYLYRNLPSELSTFLDYFCGRRVRLPYHGVMPCHFWCRWWCRLALRAVACASMVRTKKYTHELERCYLVGEEAFKNDGNLLRRIFEMERTPTNAPSVAGSLLAEFSEFYCNNVVSSIEINAS